jgi:hypothetical protein
MTDALTRLVIALNTGANTLGEWLFAPIGVLPGWLSATAVAVATGVLLLFVFKYTSNQQAIKRVRDDINANLLALKLFKQSARVTIEAQGHLLAAAGRLLVLALIPTAVMILPVTLFLGQLALWYQQRPLRVGEEAVVTLELNGDVGEPFPAVSLRPTDAVETIIGPVRVFSKREVCWNIKARQNGHHRLTFQVDGQTADKELAIDDGYVRVSIRRPGWAWSDALLHPAERPFTPDFPVRSIEIDYPARSSWTSGTDHWVIYWFAVSLAAAFCFRRVLGVSI